MCRQKARRDQLLRIVVASDGTVCADRRRALPGRGAWLHPAAACISSAAKDNGRIARALRTDGSLHLERALEGITNEISTEQKAGWKLMGTR